MKSLLLLRFLFTAQSSGKDVIIAFKRHNQELNYCSRKEVAFNVLKGTCREFWGKALKNPVFNNAVILQSKKLELKSSKVVYKVWEKYILSLADGDKLATTSKNETEVLDFIKFNGDLFYKVIQIISQHIDFSNRMNTPFLSALVSDLVKLLPKSVEFYEDDLPGIDLLTAETIVQKAIKIEEEIKKHQLDKFTFEGSTRQEIKNFFKANKIILRDLNDLSSVRKINNNDLCYSNGISSRLFYNHGEDSILCNDNWMKCANLNLFAPNFNVLNDTAYNQYDAIGNI